MEMRAGWNVTGVRLRPLKGASADGC